MSQGFASVAAVAVTAKQITATASGETEIIAPLTSGNAIRLWSYQLAADSANSAKVVASLRFGTGGTDFFKDDFSQYGGKAALNIKAGNSYLQGTADAALIVNLSAAQTVYANITYTEVVP